MKSTYTIPILLGLLIIGGLFYLQTKSRVTGDLFTDPTGTYSVTTPSGWYPHPLGEDQVIFTPSEDFELPEGTEGYAIGDQMVISMGSFDEIVGAKTPEAYLAGIGATSTSEFFVAREDVTTDGDLEMTRVVMKGAAADGETLLYVYFPGGTKVITLSHYPYVEGSPSAKAFDTLVQMFKLTPPESETPTATSTTTGAPVVKPGATPVVTGQRILGGFIRSINTEAPVTISLDDAVWRTGTAAEDAAIRAGMCTEATRSECVPNDYFIENVSPLTMTLLVDSKAVLKMKTWNTGGVGIQDRDISVTEFASLINDASAHWNKLPYRVTIVDDMVVKIEEIYVP